MFMSALYYYFMANQTNPLITCDLRMEEEERALFAKQMIEIRARLFV